MMVPGNSPEAQRAIALEPWLKEQFTANVPYDEVARKLVTAKNDGQPMMPVNPRLGLQAGEVPFGDEPALARTQPVDLEDAILPDKAGSLTHRADLGLVLDEHLPALLEELLNLVRREVRGPGSASESITDFEYDGNRNLTRRDVGVGPAEPESSPALTCSFSFSINSATAS